MHTVGYQAVGMTENATGNFSHSKDQVNHCANQCDPFCLLVAVIVQWYGVTGCLLKSGIEGTPFRVKRMHKPGTVRMQPRGHRPLVHRVSKKTMPIASTV